MNKMKWLSVTIILIAAVSSFLLLQLDSQSEQGLLNTFFEKDNEQENKQVPEKMETKTEASDALAEQEDPFLICIDPGHQLKANLEPEPIGPGAQETKYKVSGGTTGAVTGTPEHALTLKASILLKKELEKKGFRVIMTRTTADVNISNKERAEIANQQEADLFVRVHADGSESAKTSGFSVLVPAKDTPYTTAIFADSEQAAKLVLASVSQKIPLYETGLFYRSNLSGFNWSKVPVILTEIGFMTNPEEDVKLADSTYLTNLMQLTANGIEQYAKTKQEMSE
ncbi:N-acetylmuramoyl-L-alanine amidase [Bacillus sp. REN10]|uniref:N-acetylmuramoyl-L-alanine amidase n=1 Tax=Bacillus sp. REN10 TaxID=2782541 RepID=UPI00193C4DA9|nr:N-acetylmuramoyl-L-alanine amidase [Bacillus sp. REN10]